MTQFKFKGKQWLIENKELLIGWTIGAGVDQAFTKNLIGRVEYLYADYGHKNFTVTPASTHNIGFKAQVVRGRGSSDAQDLLQGGSFALSRKTVQRFSGRGAAGAIGSSTISV